MIATENPSAPREQRLSRYRSIRNAVPNSHSQSAASPSTKPTDNAKSPNNQSQSIARSMSRYHRKKPVRPDLSPSAPKTSPQKNIEVPQDQSQEQTLQASPNLQRAQRPHTRSSRGDNGTENDETTPESSPKAPKSKYSSSRQPHTGQVPSRVRSHEHDQLPNLDSNEEAQQNSETEHERARRLRHEQRREAREAAKRKLAEEESQERDERHAQRREAKHDRSVEDKPSRATPKATTEPIRRSDYDAPVTSFQKPGHESRSMEMFHFLRKKKVPDKPAPASEVLRLRNVKSAPQNIEPGGGGIVPGIDAPVSAVNAGERKVLVECGRSFISLPVTPTTTAMDLIYSAANCLSEDIKPKAAILRESFKKLGLERPLRRYERVRDVMNSWDGDTQNSLILTPVTPDDNLDMLDVKFVPEEQPPDITVHIYWSQKPGKWDKRYITLRTDGQVVMSKKNRGDTTNICHISDFDIYAPTERQLKKKIKAPKKVCFAVKSQQKSSMFLSTENFVHFFATNDRRLAAVWYKTVQHWRSWYLVRVLGEGLKQQAPEQPNAATVSSPVTSHKRHPTNNSSMSAPYQIGTFKSLLDLDQKLQDIGKDDEDIPLGHIHTAPATITQDRHGQKQSARDRTAPPVSYPKKLNKDSTPTPTTRSRGQSVAQNSASEDGDVAFAPTGLLGRTYSQRQKAAALREQEPKSWEPVAEERPRTHHGRTMSMKSSHEPPMPGMPGGLNRAPSNRQPHKPLIDLTPQYREPPQWVKKGKGYHPEQVGPGGLIDCATSPEQPYYIPPAAAWRKEEATVWRGGELREEPVTRRSNTMKSVSRPHFPSASIDATGRDHHSHEDDAFTGSGLLARAGTLKQVSGGKSRGRGVASGDRNAKGPMLNLKEPSQFVQGSLLADVEKQYPAGIAPPIIDRSKEH
ncbi:MAG: hypothetical protein M1834_004377 [Cirrosporium novae-zelandiae]|nr:MAG: hypothetical protein M1834_004377 [Cirrosporium novae-zelandiae]